MSKRARDAQLRAAGLAIFAVIAVAIAGVWYGLDRFKPAALDPDTLCAPGVLAAHTAVVLDKTDAYTEPQSQRIAALIRKTRDDLAVGERMTIFVLDAKGEFDPRGALALCNPGRGDQANALVRNPKQIQERYEELFKAPFERIMADLVTPKVAPKSPILEALARLAQTEAFSPEVKNRHVLLVSDMLQNSALFNVYGGSGSLPSGLPAASTVAETIEKRDGSGLRGVNVEIRLIPREGFADMQRGALKEYWNQVFDALGVRAEWRDL
jgi:hypothetical protein